MTTSSEPPRRRLRDRLDGETVGLIGVLGLFAVSVTLGVGVTLHERAGIAGALRAAIADPDRRGADSRWQGQLAWQLGERAALLCGLDDFGRPRAVVAKVRDGRIRRALWANSEQVEPQVAAFCASALKRQEGGA